MRRRLRHDLKRGDTDTVLEPSPDRPPFVRSFVHLSHFVCTTHTHGPEPDTRACWGERFAKQPPLSPTPLMSRMGVRTIGPFWLCSLLATRKRSFERKLQYKRSLSAMGIIIGVCEGDARTRCRYCTTHPPGIKRRRAAEVSVDASLECDDRLGFDGPTSG